MKTDKVEQTCGTRKHKGSADFVYLVRRVSLICGRLQQCEGAVLLLELSAQSVCVRRKGEQCVDDMREFY